MTCIASLHFFFFLMQIKFFSFKDKDYWRDGTLKFSYINVYVVKGKSDGQFLCNCSISGTLPVTSVSPWSTQSSVFSQAASVFPASVMGAQPTGFAQPLNFGTQPASFPAPAPAQSAGLWGQPARVSPTAWAQPSTITNPFQSTIFPPTTLPAQSSIPATSPPQPPPRTAPQKEASKKESDAFTALDPLGDKEMKDVKEMFKDFQLSKPPAVPARRGEQQSLPGTT